MLKATIKTTKKPEGSTTYDEIEMNAADREELERNFRLFTERYTNEYSFELTNIREVSLASAIGLGF